MECQVDKKEYFQHLLLFAFIQGAKATNAAREICEVYGEEAMSLKTAPNWFKRASKMAVSTSKTRIALNAAFSSMRSDLISLLTKIHAKR